MKVVSILDQLRSVEEGRSLPNFLQTIKIIQVDSGNKYRKCSIKPQGGLFNFGPSRGREEYREGGLNRAFKVLQFKFKIGIM